MTGSIASWTDGVWPRVRIANARHSTATIFISGLRDERSSQNRNRRRSVVPHYPLHAASGAQPGIPLKFGSRSYRGLNAANTAPQLSDAASDALAEALPAVLCSWSSTISLVFGSAGTNSSMV